MKKAVPKDNRTERHPTPSDRWLRQAADLCGRWLPGTLAYNSPRLEFLRRASASYPVNHRWQKFVARFSPQIHLAIQPLLREMLWPDQSAERTRSGYAFTPAQLIFAGRSAPEATGFKVPASANSQAMSYRVDPVSAQPILIDHATTLAQRLRRYTARQIETDQSRLEVSVRRLTRQVRRVEERLPGAPEMVVHKTAPAAVMAEGHATPEPEQFQRSARAWESVNEAPWARAGTTPPLNIEQLADQVIRQIDSRVIAMRERMGRI